jgi:hypothetical protein
VGLLSVVLQDSQFVHVLRGEVDRVQGYTARCLEIAEEVGDSWTAVVAVYLRCPHTVSAGSWSGIQRRAAPMRRSAMP